MGINVSMWTPVHLLLAKTAEDAQEATVATPVHADQAILEITVNKELDGCVYISVTVAVYPIKTHGLPVTAILM